MKTIMNKKILSLIILLILLLTVAMAGCTADNETADDQTTDVSDVQVESNPADNTEGIPDEEAYVPLVTEYIVLGYPAEIKDDVTATCEDLEDGQRITFTTDFAGEVLELFHITITQSGDDGYRLGVLEDSVAGDMVVCVNVQEYTDGNWKPEDYNKLCALQERVNDLIMQIHEDSRFVPAR